MCVCVFKKLCKCKKYFLSLQQRQHFFQHLLPKNFGYKKWGLSLTEQPFPTDKHRT